MANKVYTATETTLTFKSSGGTVLFTPTSVANGAGRVSTQYDLGAASRARTYLWRARCRAAVAPAVGTVLRVYLVAGDGTYVEGGATIGTTDAAVTTEDAFRNATLIGVVEADSASTTIDFVRTGLIEIRARYISVGWWNALGQALSATATDMEFTLTPTPDEVQ